jgi:methylmalonyl-CoA mutase cobalamin-binding subunit
VNAVELQVHMVVVCDRMSDDRDLVEDVVEDLVGD